MSNKNESVAKSRTTVKSNSKSKSATTKKSYAPKKSNTKTVSAQKKTSKNVTKEKNATENTKKATVAIEEVKSINVKNDNDKIKEVKVERISKIEEPKYQKKKTNKGLLSIGIIISTLGLIALILTLIANRIIDKDFISDQAVMLMTFISLVIEGFGTFIILNET